MSLPRYPKYRNSGVAWIGAVPAHWTIAALNYRYDVALGKMLDAKQISGRHLAPYLRNVDVQWGRINTDNLPRMDFAGSDVDRYGLRKGDLLVCEGGEVGRAAIWEGELGDCYYQKALHRLRPRTSQDTAQFFQHVLRAAVDQGAFAGEGGKATIAHLPAEAFRRVCFAFPTADEQFAIAAFLDCETAKIDALIAEQEKLLALLAEKRQATISHTVTRGLDPNALMKDSGTPWLGEVPAHWEVTQIKRLCELITDGAHISPETEGGVFPFVSTKDIDRDGIDFEGCLFTSDASYEYLVRAGCQPRGGDVLFSKDGTIGRSIVVQVDREFVVASSLIIIRPQQNLLLPGFLNFLCISNPLSSQVESFVKGAGLPRLSIQNLLRVIGVFPPHAEQCRIAEFLTGFVRKIYKLEDEARRAISGLKERRSALIAAAVTGKIDVRTVAVETHKEAMA